MNRIKYLRGLCSLSQSDLARKSCMELKELQGIESGEVDPSTAVQLLLMNALSEYSPRIRVLSPTLTRSVDLTGYNMRALYDFVENLSEEVIDPEEQEYDD